MKLIKLKQELAQIQAKITVVEGNIEFYNLLQEKIAASKANTAEAVDGDTEGSY